MATNAKPESLFIMADATAHAVKGELLVDPRSKCPVFGRWLDMCRPDLLHIFRC